MFESHWNAPLFAFQQPNLSIEVVPGKGAWGSQFRGSIWPAKLTTPLQRPTVAAATSSNKDNNSRAANTQTTSTRDSTSAQHDSCRCRRAVCGQKWSSHSLKLGARKQGPKKLPKLDLLVGRKRGGLFIVLHAWVPNYDPKMGPKLGPQKWVQNCSCNHLQIPTKAHTHTDTHLQDRRMKNKNCKAGPAKDFADLNFKTHFGGPDVRCRNSWLQAPPILVPKLAPFRAFGDCIERTNTHNTETHDTGQR